MKCQVCHKEILYSGLDRSVTNHFNYLMQQDVLLTHTNIHHESLVGKRVTQNSHPKTTFSNAKRTEQLILVLAFRCSRTTQFLIQDWPITLLTMTEGQKGLSCQESQMQKSSILHRYCDWPPEWTVSLLGSGKANSDFIMFIFPITRGVALVPTLLLSIQNHPRTFIPSMKAWTGCSELELDYRGENFTFQLIQRPVGWPREYLRWGSSVVWMYFHGLSLPGVHCDCQPDSQWGALGDGGNFGKWGLLGNL